MGGVNADLRFWWGPGSECRFKVLGDLGGPADGGSECRFEVLGGPADGGSECRFKVLGGPANGGSGLAINNLVP